MKYVTSAPVLLLYSPQVVVTTPQTVLGDILEHFAHYTGLPVVDDDSLKCVGMVSNIDMYRNQRGKSSSVATTLVRYFIRPYVFLGTPMIIFKDTKNNRLVSNIDMFRNARGKSSIAASTLVRW